MNRGQGAHVPTLRGILGGRPQVQSQLVFTETLYTRVGSGGESWVEAG